MIGKIALALGAAVAALFALGRKAHASEAVSSHSGGSSGAAGTVTETGFYIVKAGDFPAKIAANLTGDETRWPELIRANPNKPTDPKTGNFKTLFAHEKLKLPASWREE